MGRSYGREWACPARRGRGLSIARQPLCRPCCPRTRCLARARVQRRPGTALSSHNSWRIGKRLKVMEERRFLYYYRVCTSVSVSVRLIKGTGAVTRNRMSRSSYGQHRKMHKSILKRVIMSYKTLFVSCI